MVKNECWEYSVPPIIPCEGHPRLFITKKDIPVIRENLKAEFMMPIWERIKLQSDAPFNMDTKDYGKGSYDEANVRIIESNALLYLIEGDRKKGEKAIALTRIFVEDISFGDPFDVVRVIGRAQLCVAIVYDWCYSLLDNGMKDFLVKQIDRLAKMFSIGYPANKLSSLVSHASEAQLLRDLLAAGIAIYDESSGMYNYAAGRFFDEYVPARNFWYKSHTYHQGESYGPYRFQWDMFAAWIFKRMGYRDVFSREQQQIPYHWLYLRRPDGQLMRDGDTSFSKNQFGCLWTFPQTIMLTASYYDDEYLQNEFLRQYDEDQCAIEDIWYVLFYNPYLQALPADELPLTRYFPYPCSNMIARTGWYETNSVITVFKASEYQFNNHQHLDAGQFQIYYKGALAIDSGLYQGRLGGYASKHDLNYNKRTIAHNCLLVLDEKENFCFDRGNGEIIELLNDGGQRWPSNGREPKNLNELSGNDFQTAETLFSGIAPVNNKPEYSFLCSDLTKAYSQKVRQYIRSFVFINTNDTECPAVILIYDKVLAVNSDYKKVWLLHSMEQPQVNGNISTIIRSEKGYNGKLVNYTLMPEEDNLIINCIGGSGKEFWVANENMNQESSGTKSSEELGRWRLEISPKYPENQNEFLNVMQVTDNGKEVPVVTGFTDDNFTGAIVNGRAVLFSRNDGFLASNTDIIIDCDSILILGVENGKWHVGNIVEIVKKNCIYMKVNQRKLSLKYLGSISSGSC